MDTVLYVSRIKSIIYLISSIGFFSPLIQTNYMINVCIWRGMIFLIQTRMKDAMRCESVHLLHNSVWSVFRCSTLVALYYCLLSCFVSIPVVLVVSIVLRIISSLSHSLSLSLSKYQCSWRTSTKQRPLPREEHLSTMYPCHLLKKKKTPHNLIRVMQILLLTCYY